MRGPPMPAKSMSVRLRLSAAITCEARRSPEASPATMPTRRCRGRLSSPRRSSPIGLADNAALGAVEKLHQLAHVRAFGDLRFELAPGVGEREAVAIQRTVGALEPG